MPLIKDSNPSVGTIEPVSTEPSLGIRTHADPPRFMQVPPGAHFSTIPDPKHPDTMTRWVLVSVDKNGRHINGKCACSLPDCTRTVRYTAKYAGIHPNRQR